MADLADSVAHDMPFRLAFVVAIAFVVLLFAL